MPLNKADMNDIRLLVKAGNTNAARRILQSSNDPHAITLLAQFDARFPPELRIIARPIDELTEVKRLIAQKKFTAAETRLHASSHPDAPALLKRIARLKATPKPVAKGQPRRRRSFWRSVSTMMSGFLASFN